jgi:hypothetical protein
VETDQLTLAVLVVAGAALLMILAAVRASRLEWKRPTPQRLETCDHRTTNRPVDDEPRPRWPRILAISVPCAVAGLAGGVVLASAVVSPTTLAYLAAAAFVAVLAFATR